MRNGCAYLMAQNTPSSLSFSEGRISTWVIKKEIAAFVVCSTTIGSLINFDLRITHVKKGLRNQQASKNTKGAIIVGKNILITDGRMTKT